NKLISIGTVSMYLLATVYWAVSVAKLAQRVKEYMKDPQYVRSDPFADYYTLFNVLVLINVHLDGIIMWRAWVICSRAHRKFLRIPIAFLILTAVTVGSTIVLRIVSVIKLDFGVSLVFTEIINILQMCTMGFSLISNLSVTGVIAFTAWLSKSDQILLLLMESGLLYCISAVIVLVASLIRLPWETLGDIYSPVNVQIVGAYAPVVLLLVRNHKSLNETDF
ncbi:hypothetical protein DFH07DRAFT_724958, partial [Mycena maculata]